MQIKDNVDLFRHNVAENFVMGNKYVFMGKGTIKEIKNKKTTPHILNLDLFAKIKKPI